MTEHPITPPPELVGQWLTEAADLQLLTPSNLNYLATQAARWGDDQRLKACCEWVRPWRCEDRLRAAMRPEPPSLKEQALEELDLIPTHDNEGRPVGVDVSIIRRALEALDD